jgi:raffinose/stachyose/melibiose transport system permease protein/N-acetylglucosamine transport system permease protein
MGLEKATMSDVRGQSMPEGTDLSEVAGRMLGLAATWLLRLFLFGWVAFTVFSFVWIVVVSFKTNRDLFSNVWGLPTSLHLENYVKAWSTVHMGRYFLNSLMVNSAAVFLILALSTPAAYVLSRIPFQGAEHITTSFAAGMGVPYQLLLVPLFVMLKGLNLLDNLLGLVFVYATLALPFTIFLLTAFFRSLPSELEEAAAIDGASDFAVFWRVMLPLASPGLITSAIFNFIGLWNEYLLALVMISTDSKRTISLGLYALQGAMQFTSDWVGLFAGVVIVMLPTLVIYVILSERVLEGVTLGAVKG